MRAKGCGRGVEEDEAQLAGHFSVALWWWRGSYDKPEAGDK
jgi:hypothetical protein